MEVICSIPSSRRDCLKTLDIKFDPWSDCTSLGKPNLAKNCKNYLTTVLGEVFLRGTASGYLVTISMIVRI